MMKARASIGLIFDLDGTLIESAPAITAVANTFLETLELPALEVAETISFIGGGSQQFVRLVLESRDAYQPREFDERFASFSEIYVAASPDLNRPFPGAEAALRTLKSKGYRLALCTNKPAAPTKRIVEALAWQDLFAASIAGDTLSVKKPDPAPLREAARRIGCESLIYIGDSETDAETAKRADESFVLFTEGYRKTSVEEMRCAATFSSYDELESTLESLLA